jgi:dTMP kinase
MKVMLIAIEGIDGAGKTTVASFLKKELEKRGYKVALLKEPTDSPWGKRLKESSLSHEEELELFILDREYNVKNNILPALKNNKIVILDRYYYSNIAYQGALGFNIEDIRRRNEEIAPKPDLVIILDVSPEKGVERVARRGKPDRFEDIEYLRRVREIFLSMKNNVIVIDAEQNLEKIRKRVLSAVLNLLRQSNVELV